MKRFAIISALALLSLVMTAQPGRPRPEDLSDEEFLQMQAGDMARWLDLDKNIKKQFVSTYCAFRSDIDSVATNSRPAGKIESEEEIDKALQKNFEVSEKILEIRERYYIEFKKFLKPSQIRMMYSFENEAGRRMHGGPDGPQVPGNPGSPDGPDGPGPRGQQPGMTPPPQRGR